jgi:hypothetical protein
MKDIPTQTPEYLSEQTFNIIKTDDKLRSEIVSIGIPILFPDGKTLLRGNDIKIPPYRGDDELPITSENINKWANDGWVDLRVENMKTWITRIKNIMDEANSIPEDDTSSSHVRTKDYWNNFEKIDLGKVVSWIFIHEEKGRRMKA